MLTVHLLGPIDVRVDDVSVDLGGPQQRAVVAHLALDAGRVVPIERLIDRLWGDEPPRTPLGTLQSYVSRLRRVVEPRRASGAPPEVLVSEAPGYVLRVAPGQVDVHAFRAAVDDARTATDAGDPAGALAHLDAALARWRGPALAGIGNDDLVRPIAVRLEEERVGALGDRFAALLALGRHREAVPAAQAAVEAHPLHERLWALLALALYRSSRQADALRALTAAREVLGEELGLDPGPELRELEQRILAQDASLLLDVGARHGTAAPAASSAAPSAHVEAAPRVELVGRPREWAQVTEALLGAAREPGLVLIEGEPGAGKSTLCEVFLAHARATGWRTASGRCLEAGLAPTLWPLIDVARDLLRDDRAAPDGSPAGSSGGPIAHAMSGTHATWRRLAAGKEVALATVEVADAFVALVDSVAHDGAHAGCVVFVDDLHWADRATLDLLQVALSRFDRPGVLVVAALRPPELEPGSLVGPALAGLHRSIRSVTRVRMEPLAPEAVAELIEITTGVAPPDDVARLVHRRAGGNPLFVSELARLVGERGLDERSEVPEAVRDVVRSRLAALPERAIAELEVAAVLGERFAVRTVMAASERDPESCLDALDAAIVTRILVPEAAGYRFAHALVRDAVLAGLPALRLARLHHRVADALLAVHGDVADVAEPVAHHRLASAAFADPLAVARAAVRASDVARWRNALDTAEWFAEQAHRVLDGVPRVGDAALADAEVLEALLGAVVRRRDPALMDALVARIVRHGDETNSDAARALGLFLAWGDVDTIDDLLDPSLVASSERARSLAERTTDRYALVICHYVVASLELMTGRVADAERHVRASLAATLEVDPDVPPVHVPIVLLPLVGAITMAMRGEVDEARTFAHRRARSWLAQRYEVDAATPAVFAFTSGLVEALLGEPDRAAAFLAVDHLVDEFGVIDGQGGAYQVLVGWTRAVAGDPSGVEVAMRGLDEFVAGGERALRPTLLAFAADACIVLGDDRAAELLERAEAEALGRHEVFWLPEILRLRALVDLRRGDGSQAADLLDRAASLAADHGSPLLEHRVAATRRDALTGR